MSVHLQKCYLVSAGKQRSWQTSILFIWGTQGLPVVKVGNVMQEAVLAEHTIQQIVAAAPQTHLLLPFSWTGTEAGQLASSSST